jgi:hypothetical protein
MQSSIELLESQAVATVDDFELESLESLGAGSAVAVFRAADNSLVAEVSPPIGAAALAELVATARSRGIGAIWARGSAPSEDGVGFEPRRGYARLQAINPLTEIDAARPALALVPELQIACFSGIWGHHRPALEPDPDTIFVGLHEARVWVGICEVDLEWSQIDSPGLLPRFRTSDRYARLVREASSLLTPGLVTLETWGDTESTLAAYHELGFELVEYVPGWELVVSHDGVDAR